MANQEINTIPSKDRVDFSPLEEFQRDIVKFWASGKNPQPQIGLVGNFLTYNQDPLLQDLYFDELLKPETKEDGSSLEIKATPETYDYRILSVINAENRIGMAMRARYVRGNEVLSMMGFPMELEELSDIYIKVPEEFWYSEINYKNYIYLPQSKARFELFAKVVRDTRISPEVLEWMTWENIHNRKFNYKDIKLPRKLQVLIAGENPVVLHLRRDNWKWIVDQLQMDEESIWEFGKDIFI